MNWIEKWVRDRWLSKILKCLEDLFLIFLFVFTVNARDPKQFCSNYSQYSSLSCIKASSQQLHYFDKLAQYAELCHHCSVLTKKKNIQKTHNILQKFRWIPLEKLLKINTFYKFRSALALNRISLTMSILPALAATIRKVFPSSSLFLNWSKLYF